MACLFPFARRSFVVPHLRCMLLTVLLAAVGCEETRTVLVKTEPAGANVSINGKLAGASPCKVQWKDARPDDQWELHVIEAKAKGYAPQQKEIRYRTGEAWLPEKIELKLVPADGLVPVEAPNPAPEKHVTWTPKKEFPTANNTPPKPEPAEVPPPKPELARRSASEPIGPPKPAATKTQDKTTAKPESAFSIWRPKGRFRATPDPTPAPVEAGPAVREEREYHTVATTYDTGRLFTCEVRLVRLSDGRVLGQASLLAPYSRRKQIADVLVRLLAKDAPDAANIAVGCLSNRRHGSAGRSLCDEMTSEVVQAVRQSPGLRYVKQVNLRNVILDEEMVESPKIVSDRRIAHLFTGADHVIVGGAAMVVPVKTPTTPSNDSEPLPIYP